MLDVILSSFNSILKNNKKNFLKNFQTIWFFLFWGVIGLALLFFLSNLISKNSYSYYACQNTGIFIFFYFFLLAYTSLAQNSDNNEDKIFKRIKVTLKKTPQILALFIISFIIFLLILGLEVGFSFMAHLPYAGAVIVALATIPFFLINGLAIYSLLTILLVSPVLISKINNLKLASNEILNILKNKKLEILLFFLISLPLLILSLYFTLIFFRYTAGLIKAIHWKIALTYPKEMNHFLASSFFADLIKMITPRVDSLAEFKLYGFKIFSYIDSLRYLISFSYIFLFSFVLSWPLTFYFKICLLFVERIKE